MESGLILKCSSFLLFLISILILNEYMYRNVLASPVFDREEIKDDTNDMRNMENGSKAQAFNSIDIQSATYSSDGRFLNATLWLSGFRKAPPREEVVYGMLVDADLKNNTGNQGIDYQIEIQWNNATRTWTRVFNEFSSGGNQRSLEKPQNITDFFGEKKNEMYVRLDGDLNGMLTPEKYRIFFYAYASGINNSSTGKIITPPVIDPVRWAYVPPPEFTMSIQPALINLTAGETKAVLVQAASTTAFQPIVTLKNNYQIAPGIRVNYEDENFEDNQPNKTLTIPPFGIATTNLNVETTNEARSGLHKFFVTGNFELPKQNFTIPLKSHPNVTINSTVIPIDASFMLNLEPFSLPKQLKNWSSDWFNPISGLILAGIAAVSGILGWKFKK